MIVVPSVLDVAVVVNAVPSYILVAESPSRLELISNPSAFVIVTVPLPVHVT